MFLHAEQHWPQEYLDLEQSRCSSHGGAEGATGEVLSALYSGFSRVGSAAIGTMLHAGSAPLAPSLHHVPSPRKSE
jgi:hypothetical protein